MSKVEILNELPRLAREDRDEIRRALAELDSDGWLDSDSPLTPGEKVLIEDRLARFEAHPERSQPWPDYCTNSARNR